MCGSIASTMTASAVAGSARTTTLHGSSTPICGAIVMAR
jgi:hypothetical protein